MSVKSAPYYWLTCDEPGCTARSTEHDEFAAYSDAGHAADSAVDGDWTVNVGPDKLDYCEEHARYVCEEKGCDTVISRADYFEYETCAAHREDEEAGQ